MEGEDWNSSDTVMIDKVIQTKITTGGKKIEHWM